MGIDEVRISVPLAVEPVVRSLVNKLRVVGHINCVAAVVGHARINEVRIGLRAVEVRLDGMCIAVGQQLCNACAVVDFCISGILREDTEVPRIAVLGRLHKNPAASQDAFWLNYRTVVVVERGLAIPYVGDGLAVATFVVAVQSYYFVPIDLWYLVNYNSTEVVHGGNACCSRSVNASGVDGRALDCVLHFPLAGIGSVDASSLFLGKSSSADILVHVGYHVGIYKHLVLRAS